MDCEYPPQSFTSFPRSRQSLCNERCQNILYKAVFEQFSELKDIAALLLASKSFQNSSFGANFLVNFIVDEDSIDVVNAVLSPSSCMSMQFVPSLHVKRWVHYADEATPNSERVNRGISNFLNELAGTKYLHLSLRSLMLDTVTNEVLSPFFGRANNSWSQLSDLTLKHCELNDSLLAIISTSAVQLRAVSFLESSGFTDVGLADICNLSNIESLDLSSCHVTDAGLEHISKLANIASLSLWGWGTITDAGLEHLSKLPCIATLDFYNCNLITDAGLEHLSVLSSITSLSLRFCYKITDAGMEHISKLSGITSLDLDSCSKITDAALQHVSNISRITSLKLRGCNKITDIGLAHLSKLTRITSLDISYCDKITDAGLEHISKLFRIKFLNFTLCKEITDAGLEHVAKLTRITFLEYCGCYLITSEARKKLQTALIKGHIRC